MGSPAIVKGAISALYSWQYTLRMRIVGQYYRIRALRYPGADPGGSLGIENPDRLLIIVAGLIGDSVMCTPVIMEARRLWPGASITLLGQRHNCALLSSCPALDSCHETPAIPFTIAKRRLVTSLRKWLEAQRFDMALILLGDQFSPLLCRAGIPIRVGGKNQPLSACLSHAYDAKTARTWGPNERLNALRVLGCQVQETPPRLWVSDAARASAQATLGKLGLSAGSCYALVHPFGSTPRQWWPLERVEALAGQMRSELGLRSLLIGNRPCQGTVSVEGCSSIIDAVGRFTLQELLALVQGASLVISTDSGPFHIAGALGTPTIGLFRSSRPEHAGRYPDARVLLGKDPRCEVRCRWNQCRAEPCRQIASLTVAEVMTEIPQLRGGH